MVNAWRHESFFEYNVTRPYPFRWFTPSVIFGTIVCMAGFTLVNLVTQGLQIITVSTVSPGSLVNDWEASLPSFLTKRTRPQCSPVQIPVGTQVYSSKKGLSYRLAAVKQRVDGAGEWTTQSALQYSNDYIQNCTVTALSVSIEGKSRTPQERAWMEWAPEARAFIVCDIPVAQDSIFPSTISGSDTTIRVNLTSTYSYVSEDIAYGPGRISNTDFNSNPNNNGLSSLVAETPQQARSLFWGASLLSMFWTQTGARMTNETERNVAIKDTQLSSGIVYFQRNADIKDIKDLRFFDIDYRMFYDESNGDLDIGFANATDTISSLTTANRSPNIWIPTDSLAKSFWSTIMADLGDTAQTQVIVGDPALTTYFTANFTAILEELSQTRYASARPGPSLVSFTPSSADFNELGLTKSTIDAQFLCQVPVWKNPGEVFILVLAQNIVFLSSVWAGWKLFVGALFLRPNRLGRDINYCAGHIDDHRARTVSGFGSAGQPMEAASLMSRRWQRQEEQPYDGGSGYRAIAAAANSPPPPVSRFSKDFKLIPQVSETER